MEIKEMVVKARKAQEIYEHHFDQDQVERVIREAARVIYDHAEELARLAVDETGMGVYEHKVAKNRNKSKGVYYNLRGKKSMGIIDMDEKTGLIEIAKPIGVVAGITPMTNPIVTPMSKIIFALKTKNAIIIAPHPQSKRCSALAVNLIKDVVAPFGVPADLIQVIDEPSIDKTKELMEACDVVVATGGMPMFRFVQITDMHVGTLVRPERELTRLADSVNAQRPEAVFFTGDLVNIRAGELDERTTALLRRIAGPVWSVTGNHDVGTYIKDSLRFPAAGEAREVVARQRAMGWTVLEDTTVYLRRGADSISLTGLSFDPALRERRHDRDLPGTAIPKAYAGVPDSLYNIALVHIPQLWEQIVEAGYGDLTLSGHVHSMQLKIRPWGRGWSPAKWIYKHWSGRYDTGRHTLYVNDGTGYVAYPMRLGAWPEVTLFTLKRCR